MTAIHVENVSKLYRLGTVGTGTITHDLNRWWHRIRGKEDPYSKVGQVNDRSVAQTDSTPDYVWALRDINLEVEQGEVLGIIGRNGAGKSTLLKLLSRVTAPTTGVIKARGRIASLLEVGTGFHPELTGRENIYLNGAILGMRRSEIRKELDSIVDFSGCARYIDTPVKRYSSGMMVRLGFAVAAYLRCEILIVDEVLAVGDAEFQKRCIGKISQVTAGGRTTLLVSHNMGIIRSLATQVALLSNGTVQVISTPSEAVDQYLRRNDSESPGTADLTLHPNRLPRMQKYLTRLTLTDQAGNLKDTFTQDEQLIVDVEYNANQAALNLSGIGLIIENTGGHRVGSYNTYMQSPPPHKIKPSGTIRFKLDPKTLNPGAFLISVSLGNHQGNLVDKIEHAVQVKIEPSDIYGTGYLLTSEDGSTVLPCKVEEL